MMREAEVFVVSGGYLNDFIVGEYLCKHVSCSSDVVDVLYRYFEVCRLRDISVDELEELYTLCHTCCAMYKELCFNIRWCTEEHKAFFTLCGRAFIAKACSFGIAVKLEALVHDR